MDRFDVVDLLADLKLPTLVLHARDDGVHPLDQGRKLAGHIENSTFIMLESRNHAILEGEPAWASLFEEMTRFVSNK